MDRASIAFSVCPPLEMISLQYKSRKIGHYLIGLIWSGEKISALFIKIQDGGNADLAAPKVKKVMTDDF